MNMNETWLYLGLGLLSIIALVIAYYPLRSYKKTWILLTPIFLIALAGTYWYWGAEAALHQYLQAEVKQQQVKAVLASIRSPNELVDKLKAQLQKQPESAKGWYLLGRVYVTQDQWKDAATAFAKAYQLQPDDERITVNYAQALWEVRQRNFDEDSHRLLSDVLTRNPNQPDALAMLAMEAYMRHDNKTAIEYWQRLLALAPQDSKDAQAIRKAIAKAQINMKSNEDGADSPG
jgi:cytochrome c-type biogenesis protein CcmH